MRGYKCQYERMKERVKPMGIRKARGEKVSMQVYTFVRQALLGIT